MLTSPIALLSIENPDLFAQLTSEHA